MAKLTEAEKDELIKRLKKEIKPKKKRGKSLKGVLAKRVRFKSPLRSSKILGNRITVRIRGAV